MNLLEARGINRRFGGVQALSGVDVNVPEGKIKAVIGPNGAGKTTLFNVISGVIAPDSGSLTFRGRNMVGLKPYQIARMGISRTFQNVSLFANMTVLDNVLVGRHTRMRAGWWGCALHTPRQRREERAARETAMECLAFVGLEREAGREVGALSFGRRRMVELARALATDPALLLLDEPASGLNTKETADFAGLIRRIRDRGVTLLLVEHDMSLVMDISDEILVLNFGAPIAEGSPADVRAKPEVISVYLGGEFDDVAG